MAQFDGTYCYDEEMLEEALKLYPEPTIIFFLHWHWQFPHPRSFPYIQALSVVRGGQSGLAEAEAFELIRRIE